MRKRGLNAIVLLFLMLVTSGHTFQSSPWTKGETYNKKMFGKLGFGFTNASLGFLEIFQEPYAAVKEERVFWLGVAEGLGNGVADTVGGVLHLVTFFITSLDIPLPEGGTELRS